MKYETAGDPMKGLKWSKKSTRKIAKALSKNGIIVSSNTVGRLLKQMDFSLKSNKKVIAQGGKKYTKQEKKDRNSQFAYIKQQRIVYEKNGSPIISIDTKKKEKIGNFSNKGRVWTQKDVKTYDHDFRSYADGVGIPFGIYDCIKNTGSVFVGTTFDTSEFEVDALVRWWNWQGKKKYQGAKKILILSDSGGSSGYRTRMWKLHLQEKFCNKYKIEVTVSHYPTGASKWNPIEHRLFSEISKNWAGEPLTDYKTMLNFIGSTTTTTGLQVKAYLLDKHYEKGQKVSNEEYSKINLISHELFSNWNYTIKPA